MSSTPSLPTSTLPSNPESDTPVAAATPEQSAPTVAETVSAHDATASTAGTEVSAELAEAEPAVEEEVPAATSSDPASAPTQPAAAIPSMTPAECALQLKQRFPAVFSGPPKPLKLRIQADIQERAPGLFSKQVLSSFLRRHTGSHGYLLAITRAPHRFDLDGAPAGEIAADHKQAAVDELTRRRGLQDARRAEEIQQRRSRAELLFAYRNNKLSEANFCALKGIAPEALEGLIEMAKREAEEDAAQRPIAFDRDRRPPQRDGRGPNGPRDARAPGAPGDARPPRGPQDSRGPRGPQDARGPRGPQEARGPRGPRR
ncbi:hypothetical protein BH11PSE9_BH11PSE9_12020 [soil metagenome]